jgi:MoxR-like ATPase
MSEGKFQEAEALLDRLLMTVNDGPPESLQRKMQALQQAVQKRQQEGGDLSPVGRIMQKFEPLMKEGKVKEAEAVIDEALKLLEENR